MLLKQLLTEGKTGPYYHAVSRPPLVDAEATHRAIHLAALAQAPLFVVHVTCKEAMEAARDSYSKGLPIFGETCSHYLVLDTENLAMPDFEGAKYVCSPPLRSQEHRNALREAVKKGWLKCVSFDHCGHCLEGSEASGQR
jgi:dihydropyrimidinase